MTRSVDVRVLATTNRDLQQEVQQGRFRQDLYFRLAVLPLSIPPLRDRREDVPALVDHFLQRAAARLQQDPPTVEASSIDLLVNHCWPGNVRELENIVTRATVLCGGQPVTADLLRTWLLEVPGSHSSDLPASPTLEVGTSLQDMERRLIEATLDHYDGHRGRAGQALGIGIRTLANKLRAYGYAPRERSFSRAA